MYTATFALLALAQTVFSAPIVQRQSSPCPDAQGAGVCISNAAGVDQVFSFYRNSDDGNGHANPAKDPTDPDVSVTAGQSTFVPLDMAWKGRVMRTRAYVGTYVEFQIEDTLTENHVPDHKAHGDISLIQGYDGAATITAMDDGAATNGFTNDIQQNAGQDTLYTRPQDGKVVIANVEFNAFQFIDGNANAGTYEDGVFGPNPPAYIHPNSPVNDVASSTNRLLLTFY